LHVNVLRWRAEATNQSRRAGRTALLEKEVKPFA
jgi:hypothetical protein